MSVKQTIQITNRGLSPILSIAQGTGAIEYEFTLSDYDIPAGSAAVAYNIQPTGNIVSKTCSISGNTITVQPPAYFFLRGKNYMQFQISNGGKDLISFLIEVWCAPNIFQPEVVVTNDESLVSQMLSEIGLLSSRVDNLMSIPEGSTSADAALADIKVGWDGTTYDTPGDAVREQVVETKGTIQDYALGVSKGTKNILNLFTAKIINAYNDGSKLVYAYGYKSILLPVSVEYKMLYRTTRFAEKTYRFSVATIKGEPSDNLQTYKSYQNDSADSILLSVDVDDKYLVIGFYSYLHDNLPAMEYFKNIVVTVGTYEISDFVYPLTPKIDSNSLDSILRAKTDILNYYKGINLFDKSNATIINMYPTSDNVLTFGENFATVVIPVDSERTSSYYNITRYGQKGSRFAAGYLTSEIADGVTVYGKVQDDSAENIQIIVPLNSNAKYIIAWLYSAPVGSGDYNEYLDGIEIVNRYLPPVEYSDYYIKKTGISGKKINFFGDSFTDDLTSYEYILVDRTACVNIHCGKGNSAIVTDADSALSFLSRIDTLDSDADITIIFGGINDARDLSSNAITMGNIDSAHDKTTFYGGMQLLLDEIISEMPQQLLFGVIPPSFQPNPPYTTYLPEIQNAEREIYKKYHIPYVDLSRNCFAMSENTGIMSIYRKSINPPTNYHPNALGQSKIADCIQGILESYMHVV